MLPSATTHLFCVCTDDEDIVVTVSACDGDEQPATNCICQVILLACQKIPSRLNKQAVQQWWLMYTGSSTCVYPLAAAADARAAARSPQNLEGMA